MGTFIGSSFALIRFALVHSRALIEGLMRHQEHTAERDERTHLRIAAALDVLTQSVVENSALLRRLAERIEVIR